MELYDYWTILRRRWWLPVSLMVLTALLSAWQLKPWQSPPPTYQASLRMLIGVNPLSTGDTTAYDPRYYAWLTSEYLIDDFTEVVRSTLFAENVSQRLGGQGIELPAGIIQGSTSAGKLHRIISLTIQWPDQAQLDAIASAIVAELTESYTTYFRQLGTDEALITLLDAPVVGQVPPSARSRVEFPLRVLLGLILGVGLLLLWDYLDRSVRNRRELESLGLAVIGEIPKHN